MRPLPGSMPRRCPRVDRGRRVHRTPFRPHWTELKGFGSSGTVAVRADGDQRALPARRRSWCDALMARRRFTAADVLKETGFGQLAVAPDGSAAVYARRTIEAASTGHGSGACRWPE